MIFCRECCKKKRATPDGITLCFKIPVIGAQVTPQCCPILRYGQKHLYGTILNMACQYATARNTCTISAESMHGSGGTRAQNERFKCTDSTEYSKSRQEQVLSAQAVAFAVLREAILSAVPRWHIFCLSGQNLPLLWMFLPLLPL